MSNANDTGPAIGIKTDIVVQGNVNIAKTTSEQYLGQFVGPLSGNVTGNLTGNVTGNLTGDVTGDVSGNAGSATILQTARSINVQDNSGDHSGTQASFDGSDNVMIKLPGTISASLVGNQGSATKLQTARTINVEDADGTNLGTGRSFNGRQDIIIKLPQTIKASLTGNADTATSAVTASKIGSSTIGSSSKPVFINQGVPQQISGQIGAQNQPIFVASDGSLTAGNLLGTQSQKDATQSLQSDSDNLPTATQVRGFVNSSVSTNTANYISNNGEPFTSVQQLEQYSGTVTNNDYQFVTGTDSAGNTFYDRYKATVSGTTVSWAKEYRLNNSSFTSSQWDQISSGVVQQDVTNIRGVIAGTTFVPKATYATSAGSANTATSATSATTATTATTATKLGSQDVGDSSHPIYLDNGQPVQCSSISATDADHVPYTGITSNPWHVTDYTPVPPGIPPAQWSMTTLIVNNQAHDSG